MKKEQRRQVVLFTQRDGAVPAYSVHLACRGMSYDSFNDISAY